jgi:hypothetical protein
MRIRRVIVASLAASLCASYASAAQLPPLEKVSPAVVAAARQAIIEQRPSVPEQKAADKAVSRTDKMTVDITGTIHSGTVYSDDSCGYGAGDVLVLFMSVRGQWVSVACAGAALSACANTSPGQRIRVQGTLVAAPDFLDPDFDACDPSSWFVGPVNFLFATKVTK